MPGRSFPPSSGAGHANRVHARFGLFGLFGILCAFTLTTWDGDDLAPRILSGLLFVLTGAFFSWPTRQKINLGPPILCLLLATGYGLVQTLFFPQKILSCGWIGVLFWFAAALIVCVAMQIFRVSQFAGDFRLFFIVFGTAICLLDLLQQASQTNRYFWLIPSRYHSISGPFAYWNNFAQFVELLLPVTLWRGLNARKPGMQYLLCAAVQIGAVVASGSRAGTFLVTLELLVLIVLAYGQNRSKTFLLGAAAAIGLTVIFVYAAGFHTVIAKLQQSDQLTVRRNIDKSSLAMIKARPLTGWGLDTYVPVYRMFALYDDGTYVNRAHNDWLQWAAEGGLPFAAVLAVMVMWSIRPAIHSRWGLGLIAICIHALVDYPFARLGVCGWYFALLGMLAATRSKRHRQDLMPGRTRRLRSQPASGF